MILIFFVFVCFVLGVKEKLKLRAMPSEAVLRNGALISAEAKHTMVMKVMWGLLRREEDEKGSGGVGEQQQQHKRKRSEWRRGGCLTIGDALRLLDDADLSVLRNQNGGLQALLRNHGHVFLGGPTHLIIPLFILLAHSAKGYCSATGHARARQRTSTTPSRQK